MARGYPDFEGNKSGLYTKPEWAATEGDEKKLSVGAVDKGFEENTSASYTVPAGKELRINHLSGFAVASNVADADKNQFVQVGILRGITTEISEVGNGGMVAPLSPPLIFDAGDLVTYAAVCYANHDCDIEVTILGYEVDV